jgi:hypothetical protein
LPPFFSTFRSAQTVVILPTDHIIFSDFFQPCKDGDVYPSDIEFVCSNNKWVFANKSSLDVTDGKYKNKRKKITQNLFF